MSKRSRAPMSNTPASASGAFRTLSFGCQPDWQAGQGRAPDAFPDIAPSDKYIQIGLREEDRAYLEWSQALTLSVPPGKFSTPQEALSFQPTDEVIFKYFFKGTSKEVSIRQIFNHVPLQAQEQEWLAKIRAYCRWRNYPIRDCLEPLLLRICYYNFRKAGEKFVPKAYEHILETANWRANMFPLSDADPVMNEDLRKGIMYWIARDSCLRPLLIVRLRRLPRNMAPDRFKRLTVFCFEWAIRHLFIPGIAETCTVVFDVRGIALHNFPMSALSDMTNTLTRQYPFRLDRMFIINDSLLVQTVWSIARQFLTEVQQQKMSFMRSGYQAELLKCYSAHQLEKEFGGTREELVEFYPFPLTCGPFVAPGSTGPNPRAVPNCNEAVDDRTVVGRVWEGADRTPVMWAENSGHVFDKCGLPIPPYLKNLESLKQEATRKAESKRGKIDAPGINDGAYDGSALPIETIAPHSPSGTTETPTTANGQSRNSSGGLEVSSSSSASSSSSSASISIDSLPAAHRYVGSVTATNSEAVPPSASVQQVSSDANHPGVLTTASSRSRLSRHPSRKSTASSGQDPPVSKVLSHLAPQKHISKVANSLVSGSMTVKHWDSGSSTGRMGHRDALPPSSPPPNVVGDDITPPSPSHLSSSNHTDCIGDDNLISSRSSSSPPSGADFSPPPQPDKVLYSPSADSATKAVAVARAVDRYEPLKSSSWSSASSAQKRADAHAAKEAPTSPRTVSKDPSREGLDLQSSDTTNGGTVTRPTVVEQEGRPKAMGSQQGIKTAESVSRPRRGPYKSKRSSKRVFRGFGWGCCPGKAPAEGDVRAFKVPVEPAARAC